VFYSDIWHHYKNSSVSTEYSFPWEPPNSQENVSQCSLFGYPGDIFGKYPLLCKNFFGGFMREHEIEESLLQLYKDGIAGNDSLKVLG
jgi:hypothetical protein